MNENVKPVRLTRVYYESEAAILMTALEARGIRANSTGGFTSGFRAEAPGMVEVWVDSKDLEEAKQVLEGIKDEASEIDWSQVDTGDDSPKTVEEFIEETKDRSSQRE